MCNLSYGVKAEGIRIGEILVLTRLVKKGYITVEEAAKEVDMTDQEFKEMMENPPTRGILDREHYFNLRLYQVI